MGPKCSNFNPEANKEVILMIKGLKGAFFQIHTQNIK